MKGSLLAMLGGALITVQGAANTRISHDIGTWQTAAVTQCTGFLAALMILMFVRGGNWQRMKQVKPLFLTGCDRQ
jgi:transporter family-2 protein